MTSGLSGLAHRVQALARQMRPYMVQVRRELHRHPELSGEERQTATRVARELESLGITVHRIGETGVVGVLEGGAPGPAIALRADMDALPIQEETGLPFASAVPGKMHACGHDAHTAIVLGAAKILSQMRSALRRPVKFLFQPAEETNKGANSLIAGGALEGVGAVFGLHNHPALSAGWVGFRVGPLMAAVDRVDVTVHGKGGHGASPHTCVDPIVAAASIISGLQTVVSRAVDPREAVLVTIGSIHGGEAYNVIPDQVELSGTVRCYSREVRAQLPGLISNLAEQLAAGFWARAVVDYIHQAPPVINDELVTSLARRAAERVLGSDMIVDAAPTMAGEDFAFYQEHVPGCFFWLGSGNPEQGITHGWHHSQFTIDEDCLPAGAAVLAQTALDASV